MKAILNKRNIIILSTAVLLAIIAVVSVNQFNSAGPVTGFANTVTRPIRSLVSAVAQPFGRIFAALYEYDLLVARNDELQRLVVEMQIDYRESRLLAEENDRLRSLLEFRTRHSGYGHEPASIESWGGDNWTSTFEINIGADKNITRGMGVVTEYGALIGQVHEVWETTATVITILDTKFSAAAYVGRTDTGAEASGSSVAKGDFAYMGGGMLILDKIDDDIIIRKGDMVVTSGIGTVFPAGLTIGEVHDVFRHASGIGRFAPIIPMVNFRTITEVFVITGFEETGFEEVDEVEEELGGVEETNGFGETE